jgi:hypothetical protein
VLNFTASLRLIAGFSLQSLARGVVGEGIVVHLKDSLFAKMLFSEILFYARIKISGNFTGTFIFPD